MRTLDNFVGRCEPIHKTESRTGIKGWVQLTVEPGTKKKQFFAIVYNPFGNDLLGGPFSERRFAIRMILRESTKIERSMS